MGHGSHIQCVEEDIDKALDVFTSKINKSHVILGIKNAPYRERHYTATKDLLYAQYGKEDLVARYLMLASDEKGVELVSFFPLVVSDRSVTLKVKRILEYHNRIEAVLVGEHEPTGTIFAFFDVDYAANINKYRIGQSFNFALSAIAYNAKVVVPKDLTQTIDDDIVDKWIAQGMTPPTNENGVRQPFVLCYAQLVMFLQESKKYPDDGRFFSPIRSRVKKVKFMNHEFYKMDICICHNEDGDDDSTFNIPLIVRCSDFDTKPTMKNHVQGNIWLQGRLIE